jgi:hypothetical protein
MSATTTATVGAGTVEETRVRALFVSHLQSSEPVTPETVRDAVTSAVRRHGSLGCAGLVAQEFGEHPETAVARMRWALTQVRRAYRATDA